MIASVSCQAIPLAAAIIPATVVYLKECELALSYIKAAILLFIAFVPCWLGSLKYLALLVNGGLFLQENTLTSVDWRGRSLSVPWQCVHQLRITVHKRAPSDSDWELTFRDENARFRNIAIHGEVLKDRQRVIALITRNAGLHPQASLSRGTLFFRKSMEAEVTH